MIWVAAVAGVVFAAVVLVRLLMARTGRVLHTTRLRLHIPGLHPALEGTCVALLSDLHVGRLHVPVEQLLEAVRREHPAILLLGGDYAAERDDEPAALAVVERLSAERPTFGIVGNSDRHGGLDLVALRRVLQVGGGDLLINQVARVNIEGATIEILGVDDPLRGNADVDATAAQAGADADVRIGLCHSPEAWRDLPRLRAQIALAGHSHGGQIRLPGLEAQFTHLTYPRQLASGLFRYEMAGELPRRLSSHSEVLRTNGPLDVSTEDGPLLYVTRGVGMGVVPVRVFCPPEMVVIEFVRADEAGGGHDDG